nr:unnamed protein product [Digitaria exilis]
MHQLRLVGKGITGEKAVGEVDPPEHAAVGNDAMAKPVALPTERGRVGELRLDPSILPNRVAEERGTAGAVDFGLELRDQAAVPPHDEADIVAREMTSPVRASQR